MVCGWDMNVHGICRWLCLAMSLLNSPMFVCTSFDLRMPTDTVELV